MAGDWIKWTCGLPDKPEVIRMAARLRLAREVVVCRLMKFWEWCDANIADDAIASDGTGVTVLSPERGDNVAFLDALVGLDGFAEALEAVAWVRFKDGRIELPNFGRHNGETAKTRARNTKNQKKKRQRGDGEPAPKEGKRGASLSPEMSPAGGDKTVTRGEERRDKEKKATPSSPDGQDPTHPHKLLFAAIAEVCGVVADSKSTRSLIGSVAKELLDAEPPYTPDEVQDFGRRFTSLCSWALNSSPPRTRPTPTELAKWVNKVRASPDPAPPTTQPRPAGGFKTKAEKDRDILAQQMIDSGAFNTTTPYGELT